MKKGFTLIELVVAVALLSMVLSFAGVIFNVSIESHRTAKANAGIMRNLRAITDQLNTDFAGIRTDAPLLVWFEQDGENRYDQIMFFANGDFQSIQLYSDISEEPDPNGDLIVSGNVARVYYGQAQNRSLLARRQHISTADERVEAWFNVQMLGFDYLDNEAFEHDRFSLAEWKTVDANEYDTIVSVCFDYRPWIDMDAPEATFHKLMCEGVGSFAIQWAYWDEDDDRFYWFPSNDPDGDGDDDDSHFRPALMDDEFGVYFNIPGSISDPDWYSIEEAENQAGEDFSAFPKALKFTFRLYDSKGIINEDGERGREFTHIVYLGG